MPHLSHLHARDTTLVVVSRGQLPKLRGYWERMGWTVPVVSSYGSAFNDDYQATIDPARGLTTYNFVAQEGDWAGEVPGTSVFLRDGEEMFHTYSSYARGGDALLSMYTYLDLTPWSARWTGSSRPVAATSRSCLGSAATTSTTGAGDEPAGRLVRHHRPGALRRRAPSTVSSSVGRSTSSNRSRNHCASARSVPHRGVYRRAVDRPVAGR